MVKHNVMALQIGKAILNINKSMYLGFKEIFKTFTVMKISVHMEK